MKANCKALKVSIIISIIFLILIIFFTPLVLIYENKLLEVLLNIFIGLFGSGCIALLLAIPAYNVSKRQLLEKYWHETRLLIEKFSNLQFLFNEYSDDVIILYVNELKNKKWKEEFNKISKDKIVVEDKKYKDILIKEYINNRPELVKKVSKGSVQIYASKCVDTYIEKLRNRAKEIYEQYINISKESTIELSFILGDMQFFSGKNPYIKIYNNTYQPLFEMMNKIKEECYHFQLFLDGEGSEVVALEKLLELQKEIFDVEIKESDDYKSYIINNKFLNKMLINLEEFRADMYGVEPEEQYLHPVECRTYNKK